METEDVHRMTGTLPGIDPEDASRVRYLEHGVGAPLPGHRLRHPRRRSASRRGAGSTARRRAAVRRPPQPQPRRRASAPPRPRAASPAVSPAEGAALDGRRQRAARSRARIVAAMVALVRDGNLSPSAEAVAERAAVGLRTVFRLFRDMDSLYREIAAIVRARLAPLVAHPPRATRWEDAVQEVVGRRAGVFEEMMHFKAAADAHRLRSPFLMADHRDVVRLQRQMLLRVLPPAQQRDRRLVEALDLATSIETWRRLRQDQGLGAAEAEATVRHLVTALVSAHRAARRRARTRPRVPALRAGRRR